MRTSIAGSLLLPLLSIAAVSNAQCMFPNGSITTVQESAPCSSDPTDPLHAICCAVNRIPPSGSLLVGSNYTADACLPNGICMNAYTMEETEDAPQFATYWREECTSTDWASGKCLNVCTDNVCMREEGERTEG
jgi:hypothetical protein